MYVTASCSQTPNATPNGAFQLIRNACPQPTLSKPVSIWIGCTPNPSSFRISFPVVGTVLRLEIQETSRHDPLSIGSWPAPCADVQENAPIYNLLRTFELS